MVLAGAADLEAPVVRAVLVVPADVGALAVVLEDLAVRVVPADVVLVGLLDRVRFCLGSFRIP